MKRAKDGSLKNKNKTDSREPPVLNENEKNQSTEILTVDSGNNSPENNHSDEDAQIKKKKQISSYDKYFETKIEKNGDRYGVCILCKNSGINKLISRKDRNTSGLKRHLANKHKISDKVTIDGTNVLKNQRKILILNM